MNIWEEGEDHYVWIYNHGEEKECLALATLHSCDHCGDPAYVNSCWVVNHELESTAIEAKQQAHQIKRVFTKITPLGADSEGNCYCENCYDEHAILEE